jgi:hypothetical protein
MTRSEERRRAERVRSRRIEQSKQRVSESAVLATRPVAPITARRTPSTAAKPAATGSRVRRRAPRPLKMPGIEVRLPSVRFSSREVKWRMLSLFVSMLLATAIYLAWTLPEFEATPAEVLGNQNINADEIRAVVNGSGQLIFSVVPSELELRLRQNFPELLAVHVTVGLPNQVSIAVTERTPTILWEQGDGYTWIDDTGVAFRPRQAVPDLITVKASAAPPPGLPAVTESISPTPFVSADMVSAIKLLAQQVPSGGSLVYDSRYGLGWIDPRGWQVYFGSGSREMPARLSVYQALLGLFEKKGIAPSFVSVQFPTAPYYRMNQ